MLMVKRKARSMKQIIYETKGRAREFSELACNLYDFCQHGCIYCYSPLVLHKGRNTFQNGSYSRVTPLDVFKSAKEWKVKGETRKVLLSFTTDVYQPIEQETQLTRKCIMALHENGLNVTILTKGGRRAMRDFDLLTPNDAFATTLTCLTAEQTKVWEPNGAPPHERIESLRVARNLGIETWVSLEPVLDSQWPKQLVEMTHHFCGHYKVGKLNYMRGYILDANIKRGKIGAWKNGKLPHEGHGTTPREGLLATISRHGSLLVSFWRWWLPC